MVGVVGLTLWLGPWVVGAATLIYGAHLRSRGEAHHGVPTAFIEIASAMYGHNRSMALACEPCGTR